MALTSAVDSFFTNSISPGFQVPSNQGSNGPYSLRIVNQPLPGTAACEWTSGHTILGVPG
jgi:hypothetical protein